MQTIPRGQTPVNREAYYCQRFCQRVVYDHKLRSKIALGASVLALVTAIALIPGLLGVVGYAAGAPAAMVSLANALHLGGIIGLTTVGGLGFLGACAFMLWTVYECRKMRSEFISCAVKLGPLGPRCKAQNIVLLEQKNDIFS